MTQRVLETRMVGYTTDRTGHVMAPMEVVYQCEEPARPQRRVWLGLLKIGVIVAAGLGWGMAVASALGI